MWDKRFDILMAVFVIVVCVLVGYLVYMAFTGQIYSTSPFEERDRIVQDCLRSERYSREECILLAGSGE